MTGCEALVGLALFACVARDPACLPPEQRPMLDTLAAIAEQESGFKPWAIRDETANQSIFPPTRALAERIAAERLAQGHVLGGGWFQITHARNWTRHGLTVANVFDPCTNLRAGARHFADDLQAAAIQRYNSGRTDGAPRYAASVLARTARLGPALQMQPAQQPQVAARVPNPCPGAPPAWDAWGTARHVAACARRAPSSKD